MTSKGLATVVPLPFGLVTSAVADVMPGAIFFQAERQIRRLSGAED